MVKSSQLAFRWTTLCGVRCALLAAISLAAVNAFAREEVEPNNQPENAMPIKAGEEVEGTVHYSDGHDRYELVISQSGTATAIVSGFPSDCAVQVGATGFGKHETTVLGWSDGEPGQTVRFEFPVEAGQKGRVWVRLRNVGLAISVGNWSGISCSDTGPYYTKPRHDEAVSQPPAGLDRAVRDPVTYRLRVTPAQEASDADPTGDGPGAGHPTSWYYERCHAFLASVFTERYDDAMAMTSDSFQGRVSRQNLAELRSTVIDAGGATVTGRSCLAEGGKVTVRTVLRLENGRPMTVFFVFEGDEIAAVSGR